MCASGMPVHRARSEKILQPALRRCEGRGRDRGFEVAVVGGHGRHYTKTMAKKSARKSSVQTRKGKAPKPLSVKPLIVKPLSVKPWTKAQIEEAFRRFQAANPEPKGELRHINPFTLLVAVVLSAQATDAGVNRSEERRVGK